MPPVAILGARSLVTPFLAGRLRALGYTGVVAGRRLPGALPGFAPQAMGTGPGEGWRAPEGGVVVSLMPLWALADWLEAMRGAARIVALGSTSVFGKANSADPEELGVARRLQEGEDKLAAFAAANGLSWAVLRPTLIWDGEHDANVTSIARVIERWGLFPVAGAAKGLRQPIHADEVAAVVTGAVGNTTAIGAYNVPGGETLTYRAMVARVFAGLERAPRIVGVPTAALVGALALARGLHLTRRSPALLTRMNQDLAFDGAPARQAFGYAPAPFAPRFAWARYNAAATTRAP